MWLVFAEKYVLKIREPIAGTVLFFNFFFNGIK